MEAPTMQQAESSPFLDHYADPSSKAHKDGTTGLDSTPFEAPRRIQNRKRILVSYPVYPMIQRVAKHFHCTFPGRPCVLFRGAFREFGRQGH